MSVLTRIRAFGWAVVALTFIVLAACGDSSVNLADGGIRGTGSSVGPVSGFGSVFVNGVEFFTDEIRNREVIGNDGVDTEDLLKKGMILRIKGEWRDDATGQADKMIYDDTFRGPLSADYVAPTKTTPGSVVILGQTIRIDRRTVVDNADTLKQGDTVRVSAWRDGTGYRASYVGLIAPGAEDPDQYVELEGPVTKVTQDTFSVGEQRIVLLGNTEFVEGASKESFNTGGHYFEIEGDLQSIGVVHAREIRPSDDRRFNGDEGEDVEFSGPVEELKRSDETLRVHGVLIDYSTIENPTAMSRRLKKGVLVEVEGVYLDGKVIAEEIEILEGEAEVEGKITARDRDRNTLHVGGVEVRITGRTLIDFDDDDHRSDSRFIYNESIRSLEVEGIERKDANGNVYVEAVYIEVDDDDDDEFEVTGRLQKYDRTTLTVLGLTLSYTSDTDADSNWRTCSLLEVEYKADGQGGYRATEVECEDDDD